MDYVRFYHKQANKANKWQFIVSIVMLVLFFLLAGVVGAMEHNPQVDLGGYYALCFIIASLSVGCFCLVRHLEDKMTYYNAKRIQMYELEKQRLDRLEVSKYNFIYNLREGR